MMFALRPHPDTPASQVHGLEAGAALNPSGVLELDYRLRFDPGGIRLQPGHARARLDGLWRHTCFEVFVAPLGASAYREYNFSPAGGWQAYAFVEYRHGGALQPAHGPELTVTSETGLISLRARLPAADLPPPGTWRLGLSAVLEDDTGGLSYWALAHAGKRPDFHHPDSFVLTLPRN